MRLVIPMPERSRVTLKYCIWSVPGGRRRLGGGGRGRGN